MGRTILSIIIGFVTWSVLWLLSNAVVAAISPEAFGDDDLSVSPVVLVVFLILALVFSVAAGFLTASISRAKPVRNALALGVLLLAVGIGMQSQYWEAVPLWYHLIFLVLLLPGAYAGGRLRSARAPAA